MTYLLFSDDTNLICCSTDECLAFTNVNVSSSGTYTMVVSNVFGAVTSAPLTLNVIPVVERISVPAIHLTGEARTSLNVEYTDAIGPSDNWLPLETVNLTDEPQFCFDVSTPLSPQRFYRAWQSGTPTVLPSVNLPFMVPAITVAGNIGLLLRLDYLNAIGPTDVWATLDTMTLSNTSQLYFDSPFIGQSLRLYRIFPEL